MRIHPNLEKQIEQLQKKILMDLGMVISKREASRILADINTKQGRLDSLLAKKKNKVNVRGLYE